MRTEEHLVDIVYIVRVVFDYDAQEGERNILRDDPSYASR